MVHRTFPTLGALCFVLAASFQNGSPAAAVGGAEYSEAAVPVPVPRGAYQSATSPKGIRLAQNITPPDDDATEAAKRGLKAELDRIRREASATGGSFDPPLPVRRKSATLPFATETGDAAQANASSASPQIDRLTGHLLLLSFRGTSPSDSGPKAIHSLLQAGHIAGALFNRENIQSKAQLKEL